MRDANLTSGESGAFFKAVWVPTLSACAALIWDSKACLSWVFAASAASLAASASACTLAKATCSLLSSSVGGFFRNFASGFQDPRRDPPGAHLVTRETCPVGDDDVPAVLMKDAGARRTAGATADDQRVANNHRATLGTSYGSERVHEGGAAPRGMNRI